MAQLVKSMFVIARMFKKGLEHYSRTDAGKSVCALNHSLGLPAAKPLGAADLSTPLGLPAAPTQLKVEVDGGATLTPPAGSVYARVELDVAGTGQLDADNVWFWGLICQPA